MIFNSNLFLILSKANVWYKKHSHKKIYFDLLDYLTIFWYNNLDIIYKNNKYKGF